MWCHIFCLRFRENWASLVQFEFCNSVLLWAFLNRHGSCAGVKIETDLSESQLYHTTVMTWKWLVTPVLLNSYPCFSQSIPIVREHQANTENQLYLIWALRLLFEPFLLFNFLESRSFFKRTSVMLSFISESNKSNRLRPQPGYKFTLWYFKEYLQRFITNLKNSDTI